MNDEILVVNQDDLDKVLSGEKNLEAFDLEYADLSSADLAGADLRDIKDNNSIS